MKKYLLLPSAKLIPEELRADFGALPSGMIPLRGKPALHYILASYAAKGFTSGVATSDMSWLVGDYLERHPELCARALTVGSTHSLAETILLAMDQMPEFHYLAINFADTLVDNVPDGEEGFLFDRRDDSYRWTTFTLNETGAIDRIWEKNRVKPVAGDWLTFVGIFGFSDPGRFRRLLMRHLAYPDGEVDAFYASVKDYYSRSVSGALPAENWRDFGHLDTYYRTARAESFLNGRAFNSLQVDAGRGTISKTSSRKAKLRAELDWYLCLPKSLSHLAPRVLDSTSDPDPKVELEFYSYPALADAFLYGSWDLGAWEGVLSAIGVALDAMALYAVPSSETGRRRAALYEMYVEKTLERLAEFAGTNPLGQKEEIVSNGRRYPGVPVLLREFRDIVQGCGLLDDTPFCIIHGDLCLSNILYDRRGGFVRAVDPRGSFGSYSLHGDPRYDLAKLCHSFEGEYDLLVNEVFDLSEGEAAFQLRVLSTPAQRAIRELFGRWLASRADTEVNAVHLIESLLFLSMLPLHYDRPKAQTAFLLRGLEIFWDAVAAMNPVECAHA